MGKSRFSIRYHLCVLEAMPPQCVSEGVLVIDFCVIVCASLLAHSPPCGPNFYFTSCLVFSYENGLELFFFLIILIKCPKFCFSYLNGREINSNTSMMEIQVYRKVIKTK